MLEHVWALACELPYGKSDDALVICSGQEAALSEGN